MLCFSSSANWKVWPLINIINFKFVPPKLQVLFGNFVAIFCTNTVRHVARMHALQDLTLLALAHVLCADTGMAYAIKMTAAKK